jgi:type I restriction-modification system DNA methylase subunit
MKVIGEMMVGTERTRVDTERNLLDVLDRIHAIDVSGDDYEDLFPLSQVYEGLLLKMGEKGNDGGQFFTPREVIRAIVKAIDPKPSETIYDPGCGTGGFLIEAFKHMRRNLPEEATGADLAALGQSRLYGREKENLIFPIVLANMVLHGNRRAKTLARQHVVLTGDLWRAVGQRPGALRRGADQPAVRRQGERRRADALRFPHQRDSDPVPAGSHEQP